MNMRETETFIHAKSTVVKIAGHRIHIPAKMGIKLVSKTKLNRNETAFRVHTTSMKKLIPNYIVFTFPPHKHIFYVSLNFYHLHASHVDFVVVSSSSLHPLLHLFSTL